MRIYQWHEIAHEFTDGLILGNGASIAFDSRFSYTSLRDRAVVQNLITPDVELVFQHLEPADFELVLRMLWHSNIINIALGVAEPRTSAAYKSVREALIAVVREIHVKFEDVSERLGLAASYISRFKTVASLNYDLLLYWSILAGNNADTTHQFKDGFVDAGRFRQDWASLRQCIPPGASTTIVVYPHGNLALAADVAGAECKLKAADAALLETIFSKWESGECSPVFVSEGTTEQKLASIQRSPYLSTVYGEVLPSMNESVVLFGWSVADNDLHILDAVCKGRVSRFAVAVDPTAKDIGVRQARIKHLLAERSSASVQFFNRSSPGCWLIPSVK